MAWQERRTSLLKQEGMRELREYEWITKQDGTSTATTAASKSLERDTHVWTEVSPTYTEKGKIILGGWDWDFAWVVLAPREQSVACDLQAFWTCIENCRWSYWTDCSEA
jgi:hypothetical protein